MTRLWYFLLAVSALLVLNGCDPAPSPRPSGGKSMDELLSEGDKALADGRAEDALAAFDSAVDKDPASAAARQRRGLAYLRLKNFDKAVDDCTAALKINPKLGDAYFIRGQAEKNRGELNKALDNFSSALDQSPDRGEILAARGALYREIADADTDREAMRKTLDSAVRDFDKALKQNPRDAASLLRRAEIYLDIGDYRAAIDDCDNVLAIDPDLATARVARARGFIETNELEKAVADCTAAIETEGKWPDAYVVRAKARVERSAEMRTLVEIAECDKAADDCRKALELLGKVQGNAEELRRAKKWTAAVHELRGILYDGVPADKKAFEEYSTAISMDPGLADALVRRALSRAKSKDYAGAMTDCNAAIAIDSSRPEGYYGRGMVYQAQRQFDDAVKEFEEALARKYLKAYRGLTIVYSALAADAHKKAEALKPREAKQHEEYIRAVATEYDFRQKTIDCATKALQANRHQPTIYLLRGLAYVNSGKPAQGFDDFNAAAGVDPFLPLAYYYRGVYFRSVGRLDAAILDFTRAIDLQPNAVIAYRSRAETYRAAGNSALATIDIKKYQELVKEIREKQQKDADNPEESFKSGEQTEIAIGAPRQPLVKARKELEQKLDATAAK